MIRQVTPQQAYDILGDYITKLKSVSESLQVNEPRKAGMYMIKRAREAAPKKSGALVSNIRGNRKGKGYEVTSYVADQWKYNLWANEPNSGDYPTSYGRRYSQTRRTGKPGYFDWAKVMTYDRFKQSVQTALKEVQKL